MAMVCRPTLILYLNETVLFGSRSTKASAAEFTKRCIHLYTLCALLVHFAHMKGAITLDMEHLNIHTMAVEENLISKDNQLVNSYCRGSNKVWPAPALNHDGEGETNRNFLLRISSSMQI